MSTGNVLAPAFHLRAPKKKDILICFSHLRWDFVFQRPQHLLTRAARDYDVRYFEEPIFTDIAKPELRARDSDGIRILTPYLPRSSTSGEADLALRQLADQAVAGEKPAVAWYYTPMALAFSRRIRATVTVFDCMDQLSAFHGAPRQLVDLERELFQRADIVFCGGHSLFEEKRRWHANAHAFPSSIDAAHFGRARGALADPADQAPISRPRIGFFGVVDERMDVALVDEMSRRAPDKQFVVIGPVVKIDPAILPRRDNLHWLGGKSYGQLPDYLANWDAGIMPFALNEATRFISPTKTPEFLAAGVPVVSTAVVDVVGSYGRSGLVEIATDAADMLAKIDRVLDRPKAPWLARVDAALGSTSWDRTWRAMNSLIDQTRQSSQAARAVRTVPLALEGAANV